MTYLGSKTLTDEYLNFIKKDAEAKWKNTQAPIDVLIQAAYDYGRRVKPLVWTCDVLEDRLSGPYLLFFDKQWCAAFNGSSFLPYYKTEEEAKNACQQHHNELILGALE